MIVVKLFFIFVFAFLLSSCINSSTTFAFRSNVSSPAIEAKTSRYTDNLKGQVQADKEFPINVAEQQTIDKPDKDNKDK